MNTINKLLLLAILTLCSAASLAEQTLHERFVSAVERQDGKTMLNLLDEAVRDAASADWVSLFTAAQIATYAKRVEDAHYLYHAAQMRSRAEITAFPPIDASDIPALRGALKQQTGEVVNPLMIAQSTEFIAAVKRLGQWRPAFAKDYRPDWQFDAASATPPALAMEMTRREHMASLEDLAWFLGNKKYLPALKTAQAYQAASYEEQQDPKRKAENDAAVELMRSIEKKSGRQGFIGSE
jgi:hypothetical protein